MGAGLDSFLLLKAFVNKKKAHSNFGFFFDLFAPIFITIKGKNNDDVEMENVLLFAMYTCQKMEKIREYTRKRMREEMKDEDNKDAKRRKQKEIKDKKKIEKQLLLDEIET